MPSVWEALQEIASVTRHIGELREEIRSVDADLRGFKQQTIERIHSLEVGFAELRASQTGTIRAEIATAVADLRVQWSELENRRRRPGLEEGSIDR